MSLSVSLSVRPSVCLSVFLCASVRQRVANLLCAQVNSASYPQREGKGVIVDYCWCCVVAIQSSIIMLPVSILVAMVFRNCRPRPTEQRLIKDLLVFDEYDELDHIVCSSNSSSCNSSRRSISRPREFPCLLEGSEKLRFWIVYQFSGLQNT